MSERVYRIQKAAELSGVSEELIRAWERRYGVLAPERTATGYRLYSDDDVALLKRLRELTEEGTPISQAARLVPTLRQEIEHAQERRDETRADVPALQRWHQEILRAAERMDQQAISRVLDEALSALHPLRVVDALVMPSLRVIGERWHAGELDVAQEHLATQALRSRVMSLLHAAPAGGGGLHIVCGCFPDEQHEIGAMAATLHFRYAGIRTSYLGQRTPVAELAKWSAHLGAKVIALSAVFIHGPARFEEIVRELRETVPEGTTVVLGGQAAGQYREIAERWGCRVFDEGGWDRLITGITSRA